MIDTGGGGYQGSSASESATRASTGTRTIGGINFASNTTSNTILMGVAVVALLIYSLKK